MGANCLLYRNLEKISKRTNSFMLQEIHKIESTPPNSIHMLLLIPQYLVITTGEIMFSITGLEFSYSQAPNSMKSVLQSMWLVTVAFGNVIVIIESLFDLFPREVHLELLKLVEYN